MPEEPAGPGGRIGAVHRDRLQVTGHAIEASDSDDNVVTLAIGTTKYHASDR